MNGPVSKFRVLTLFLLTSSASAHSAGYVSGFGSLGAGAGIWPQRGVGAEVTAAGAWLLLG